MLSLCRTLFELACLSTPRLLEEFSQSLHLPISYFLSLRSHLFQAFILIFVLYADYFVDGFAVTFSVCFNLLTMLCPLVYNLGHDEGSKGNVVEMSECASRSFGLFILLIV